MKFWMLAAGAASCVCTQLYAQDAERAGLRAGSFIMKPSVTVSTGFDSNIFTSGENEEGSFVGSVEPRLLIQSDWNRHELEFDAGASYTLFGSSSDDNAINTDVGLSGVIDVTRAIGISLGAGYQRLTEPRGEEDTGLALAEPVVSNNYTANLGADVVFGRFRVSPGGSIAIRDFKDADLTAGGVDNQDDRDRIEVGTTLEFGYAVRRGIEGFVRGEYGFSDYDQALDDDGINRDADSWRVLAGVNVDITRLIEASVGAGVGQRIPEDSSFSTVTDIAADVGVAWSITPLTTINFDAQRAFQETTIAGASSVQNTSVQLGVTHDLLRNLSLNTGLTYSHRDFEENARVDNLYSLTIGADWDPMRLLTISPSYQYIVGDSNEAGEDFTDHRFFIRTRYGF